MGVGRGKTVGVKKLEKKGRRRFGSHDKGQEGYLLMNQFTSITQRFRL